MNKGQGSRNGAQTIRPKTQTNKQEAEKKE